MYRAYLYNICLLISTTIFFVCVIQCISQHWANNSTYSILFEGQNYEDISYSNLNGCFITSYRLSDTLFSMKHRIEYYIISPSNYHTVRLVYYISYDIHSDKVTVDIVTFISKLVSLIHLLLFSFNSTYMLQYTEGDRYRILT